MTENGENGTITEAVVPVVGKEIKLGKENVTILFHQSEGDIVSEIILKTQYVTPMPVQVAEP